MDAHLLHTRLAALGVGVALAAAFVAATFAVLPAQGTCDPQRNYGYVYSGEKSASSAFMAASMQAAAGQGESMLVFGSSELSTPESLVPEVPKAVFGTTDYGLQLAYVGEAYDQDLWQAIALGAYAGAGLDTGRVVLIVGPGWFVDGGVDAGTFGTRFSYSLYAQFCRNDAIPEDVRAYVRGRLGELGIDAATLDAAAAAGPLEAVNGAVAGAFDDLRLRRDLQAVRRQGMGLPEPAAAPAAPDWAALRAQGEADGAARSASNDWGVEDAFWQERIAPVLDAAAGSRTDETYQDTPEYDDLACFLAVARACGTEPLVVISPVMGPYYDELGISAQTRAGCYERIRAVCAQAGVQVADFSDREYEKYFLYDIVHFGWTGWVDVEQAVYEFWQEGGRG